MDASSGAIFSNSGVIESSTRATGNSVIETKDPQQSTSEHSNSHCQLLSDILAASEDTLVVDKNIPGPYRDPTEAEKAESNEESTSSESEQSSQDSYCDHVERGEGESEKESTSLRSASGRGRARKPFCPRPIQRPSQPLEIEFDYVPRLPQAPLPSVKLLPLGKVTAFFDGVVVIQSLPGVPGLDRDSALYFADRRPMGVVYDIFGPVKRPSYVVVYENRRQSRGKGSGKGSTPSQDTLPCPVKIDVDVKVGDEIYCADDDKLSIKVLTEQILQIKAYDEGDSNEEFYSDDEEERKAKDERKPYVKTKTHVPGGDISIQGLSQPVGPQNGNQYPPSQEHQPGFQSYSSFCRQQFGGSQSTYTFGRFSERVKLAQSQVSGPFKLRPPQQQPLPDLSCREPRQVSFPLDASLQFPDPFCDYSFGDSESMPPVQRGSRYWDYPTSSPPS
nr:H:ACA ribonucleoprotein complex non core subunit [Hymenolepis microstoma]